MMIRLPLLILIAVFLINDATAQQRKDYPVKVGEIPSEVLPMQAVYLLPVFQNGNVFLRDGTTSAKPFNYNFLLDEMHFINEHGDTLAIAEPMLIKYVNIDSFTFYYDKAYLRKILEKGGYRLAIKQQMIQIPDKTRGGYDIPSATSSIKTYGEINNQGQRYQLQVKKDVTFRETDSYFISKGFNLFVKATRKNFLILFDGKKISDFIKEQKTDFNKEEDLKALLNFAAQ